MVELNTLGKGMRLQKEKIGPRMALAALINGRGPNSHGRIVQLQMQDKLLEVQKLKVNFIKAYSQLNIESF
jgi:hypothetical protein